MSEVGRGQCPASLINIDDAKSIAYERLVEAAGVALPGGEAAG